MAEKEYSVDNLRQLVKAQLVETVKEMEEAMLQLRYRELNKALPPNSHVEPGEHEAVESGVQPHMEPGTDEQFALDPIGNDPIGHSQQPVGSGTGLPMNGLPSADMCALCGNDDAPGSCQCLGAGMGKAELEKGFLSDVGHKIKHAALPIAAAAGMMGGAAHGQAVSRTPSAIEQAQTRANTIDDATQHQLDDKIHAVHIDNQVGELSGMLLGHPTKKPSIVRPVAKPAVKKSDQPPSKANELARHNCKIGKVEPLAKPSVSQNQNAAMHAAAEGKSTLGIPKSVGKDFVSADHGKKVGDLPVKKSGQPSFQQIRSGSTYKPQVKPMNPMPVQKSVAVHSGASDHWGKDNADVMAKAGTIHDAGSIGGAGDKTSVDNQDTVAKAMAPGTVGTSSQDHAEEKLANTVSATASRITGKLNKDGSDAMDGMGPAGSGPSTSGSPGMDMAMSEDAKKAELLKSFGFKKSEHCTKCGNLNKMCKCMSKKSAFAKSAKQEAAERMKKAAESAGDRIEAVDESKGSDHEERLESTKGAGTLPQDKVSERVKSGNDQDVPMEGEHTHTVKGEGKDLAEKDAKAGADLDKAGRIHGAPVKQSGKGYGPGLFPGTTQKAEEMEKMAGRIHGAPVNAAGKGYGPGKFPEMGGTPAHTAPAAAPAHNLSAPPANAKPNKVSIRPVAKPAAPAMPHNTAAPALNTAMKAEMSVPTAKPPKAAVGGMPKAPKAAGLGKSGVKLPHKGGVVAKGMGMGQTGGSAVPGADAGAATQGNGMALTQSEKDGAGEKNQFAADKRTASPDKSKAGKQGEASDYNPKDYSGFIGKDEEKLDTWAKGKK